MLLYLAAICLFFLLYWIPLATIYLQILPLMDAWHFDKVIFLSTFILRTFLHFHFFISQNAKSLNFEPFKIAIELPSLISHPLWFTSVLSILPFQTYMLCHLTVHCWGQWRVRRLRLKKRVVVRSGVWVIFW